MTAFWSKLVFVVISDNRKVYVLCEIVVVSCERICGNPKLAYMQRILVEEV